MFTNVSFWRSGQQKKFASGGGKKASLRLGATLAACTIGYTTAQAQVQNISGWTLDTIFNNNPITVGGITYLNNYATPTTVTTLVGTYNAGSAGSGADSVFIRRNTATPTANANVNGQAVSSLSASSASATVYGTYHSTMQDLLLGGNIFNSTWDTFANTSSGAGGVGHNIERIDFVWSGGYTVIGDEVIIVFNFDPIGGQDDFRVAVFTGIDDSPDLLPTTYANTGVLVTGESYPDKLPLPLPGNPITSPSTGFRTTGVDDLSGTALNIGNSQTAGIGGVAISLASLGVSAGQTIFGYSLISGDTVANTAAALVDFTNNSVYPTSTPNADASGTADFSTFGGRIATLQVNLAEGAFEWDNENGNSKWGTLVGGEANTNWYSPIVGENNRTPLRDSDVIFGKIPTTDQAVDLDNNVKVRNMTFDSAVNYTIGTSGEPHVITFGDPNLAGVPSIEVFSTTGRSAQHKINADISLLEAIAIRNNSFSVLCLNGTIETRSSAFPGGNTITVSGIGSVNFNGNISGSGDLIKNGPAIATINNNNSDDPAGSPTQWLGNIAVNEGQLVITTDGALGGSAARANNLARTNADNTLRIANANAADLKVGQLVTGTNIPAGTFIVGVNKGGANTTITLSNNFSGNIANNASITFAGVTTVNSGGSLTLRPTQTGTAGNYTTTPVNYTVAETVILNGNGHAHGIKALGALYNDGGNNILGAGVSLRLGSNSAIGSRDGNLTISGVISGAHSLTKLGEGVVTLGNAANTYTGATIIQDGVLRITDIGALPGGFATAAPSGGNLTLAGGVLEIGTATAFTRALGAGVDQVQFTGDGGFSAFDGARSVTLAGGGVIWGSGSFVPTGNALLLSSDYSNNTITFANAINLGGAVREVRVANGSAAIDGTLSGALTGNAGDTGGLLKTEAGTLNLTGTNTYTGATIIREGALRGSPGAGSNIQLDGGVRELGANYTSALGTTGGLIRWTSGGGLAADGTARTFNVGGDAQSLIWAGTTGNSQHFVRDGGELLLGSVSSSATLTFSNAIALNGAERTIRLVNSTADTALREANITGSISGGSLIISGNGNLGLTANSDLGATNTATIRSAEVTLEGANGTLIAPAGFVITQGGSLTLNNATNLNSNRLSDTGSVTLRGGTLSALGRSANSVMNETIGTVVLGSGSANTINVTRNNTNVNTRNRISAAGLTREAGSTVNFTHSGGTLGGGVATNNPTITFTNAPVPVGGVLGYATVNSLSFAGYDVTNGINAAAFVGGINDASAGVISINTTAINTPTSLTADRTHHALRLFDNNDTNDSNLNLAGFTLTLNSGGLISTRDTTGRPHASNTISNGTLVTSDNRELITHVTNSSSLNISATIGATGNTNFGLTKSGDGTLTLSGTIANTYTGVTHVNDGVLVLAKTGTGDNSTAIAGDNNTATIDVVVGDGRGTDILRLAGNEQIADTASVKLVGGELGNPLNVARLELNGSTDINTPSRIETFHTLEVTGNSVLDFGGGSPCSPTFLFLDTLTTAANSLLTIINWIEFTDYLLVKKSFIDSAESADTLPRIVFDGYPGTYRWQNFNSQYYQITPVPEPATYGILSLGGILGLIATRRRRRQS